jgi:hypothetical protein
MVAIGMDEVEMVVLAIDLDKRLGNGMLPLHEIAIIAQYHPEDETKMLIGKAMARRILQSDAPEERKAAMLSGISTECKCHIEAREDAGKALCEIIRKAKNWEKSYSIAMDSNYPPETRNMAASDFLDNSDGMEGVSAVLGCTGVSEKLREEKGFRIVRDALEKGNRALIETIRAEKGKPPMLALYIRSIIGNGSGNPRFAKERKSDPPQKSLLGVLSATGKK